MHSSQVFLLLLNFAACKDLASTQPKASHIHRHHQPHRRLHQSPTLWKHIDLVITELQANMEMEKGKTRPLFSLHLKSPVVGPVTFMLESRKKQIANPVQKSVMFTTSNSTIPQKIYVHGDGVGDTDILVEYNDTHENQPSQPGGVHVHIVHSLPLKYIATAVGWIYFVAWAVSNYPQVYTNFKRKSVVGLNFDYLSYNLTGFLAYSIFNISLFFIPAVQAEYFSKNGGSVNPVRLNDVFFGCHNTFITAVCIVQSFIYERGNQRVSKLCHVLVALMWSFAGVSLIPAILGKLHWLVYLNFFSYIKLVVTVIKYIPQVYMNFARKSTVGWSILFVILDLVGGVFSLLQMFLIAYNNDEWNSIFGDITKFGLGLLTLVFDGIFLFQHYVLYKDAWYSNSGLDTEKVIDDEKL